ANDHADNTAITYDQIRAETDHGYRNVGSKATPKIPKVGLILWHEQDLRRAANAEPGQLGNRLIGEQAAAQVGHGRFEIGHDVGKCGHAAAPSAASSPGSA